MTKYSFPKDPAISKSITVEAYGSAGTIEIFGLDYINESIFSGDHVDVFVPVGLPQMVNFSTDIRTFKNGGSEGMRTNYFYDDRVVTDCVFLDAGLSITPADGQMPIVETEGDAFDVLKTKIDFNASNTWTIYAPRGIDSTLPEFPDELLHVISDNKTVGDLLTGARNINADAINDSRIAGYDEAIDFYLLKTSIFDQEIYQTKTDNARWMQN
jgi:hypothetical protein